MKPILIVDIDGTIANPEKRIHYLLQEKKDWDSFYEECNTDTPIKPIIDLISKLAFYHKIVFCTGRRESVRQKTLNWLATYYDWVDTDDLLMRKDGDFRHDTLVKPELIEGLEVALILEDRNAMVKKWRELGHTCLQVADGDF